MADDLGWLDSYENAWNAMNGLGSPSAGYGGGSAPQVANPQLAPATDADQATPPAPPAAPAYPAAPGLGGIGAQSMIGLGMGLLAGNPFDKWGPAMKGYQAGAQADLKAQQLAETARQNREVLALRREMMNRPPEQIRVLQELTRQVGRDRAMEMLYPRTEDWIVGKIGQDLWGRETYTMYNKRTGEMKDVLGRPGGTPGSTAPATSGAVPYVGAGGSPIASPASPTTPTTTPPSEAPEPGAPMEEHEAYIRAHPEIDVKKYRENLTKMLQTKTAARGDTLRHAQDTMDAISQAENLVRNNPNTTTALGGYALSYIPGTAAHDLSQQLSTIGANTSITRLQEMRQASPTGGALGQVSNYEDRMLRDSIAALSQSQSQASFLHNLQVVKRNYYDIIHGNGSYNFDQQNGSGAYSRTVKEGKMRPMSVQQAYDAGLIGERAGAGGAGAAGSSRDNPVDVRTPTEALKLGRGKWFRNPNGEVLQVP